ncbi:hypothetical protein SAMCFNEI73_pC1247 (plasmid) [Sinorhizobium americanum]|uniref:Uncharacterized protein n=1 Tax=Sinorhizobium americanum TaxID=194963 RepID=A0A1L3LXW2_9HYPH|nr:hypothetical protein SAMCFNEI73_pC1247 [Sinorhizobium americanum]
MPPGTNARAALMKRRRLRKRRGPDGAGSVSSQEAQALPFTKSGSWTAPKGEAIGCHRNLPVLIAGGLLIVEYVNRAKREYCARRER